MPSSKPPFKPLPRPRAGAVLRVLIYGVPIAALLVLIALGVGYLQQQRALPGKVRAHIENGNSYRAEMWYDRAIKEYERALALEPTNVSARRHMITAVREDLTLKGFGPGSDIDPALRRGYERFELVPAAHIDRALDLIKELMALDAGASQDASLLFDHAMILKVGGRPRAALPLLELAYRLKPNDAAIAAELGLLRALQGTGQATGNQASDGYALVRYAVTTQPREARYRLYAARLLHEFNGCDRAATRSVAFSAAGCAAAHQEYLRAEELASGEDLWSRRIKLRAGKAARQPALH